MMKSPISPFGGIASPPSTQWGSMKPALSPPSQMASGFSSPTQGGLVYMTPSTPNPPSSSPYGEYSAPSGKIKINHKKKKKKKKN